MKRLFLIICSFTWFSILHATVYYEFVCPSESFYQESIDISATVEANDYVYLYIYKNGALIASAADYGWASTGLQASGVGEAVFSANFRDYSGDSQWSYQTVNPGAASDTQPPTVPSGLAASNITTTSFTLSWGASTDATRVGYYTECVYGWGWTEYPTQAIYWLQSGTTYQARVQAVDAAGNWVWSAPLAVTTLIAPAIATQPESQMVNGAGASITFTTAATGVPAPTYQWRKNGANIAGATNATLTVSNVQSSNVGSYDVVAANSLGSATSVTVTLTIDTPPTAPTNLNYIEKTDRSVSLTWRASNDNVGVVGYVVYRGGEEKGTTTDTVFMETGLPASTLCVYTVKAKDTAGTLSDASNTLEVTTNASSSADSDGDGIPDAIETALGTTGSTTAGDPNNQTTQQNVHRPNK